MKVVQHCNNKPGQYGFTEEDIRDAFKVRILEFLKLLIIICLDLYMCKSMALPLSGWYLTVLCTAWNHIRRGCELLHAQVPDSIDTRGGGGTHPLKGRVGSPGCRKRKIYLYHFVKKGGQFSTFKAKKGVNALPLKQKRGSMLYHFGRNLHESWYFGQNLGYCKST